MAKCGVNAQKGLPVLVKMQMKIIDPCDHIVICMITFDRFPKKRIKEESLYLTGSILR